MIVIISGSPRGDNSITTKSAIEIAEKSHQAYKLYSPADWNLSYCKGCLSCFRTGHCCMERQDDLGNIIDDLIAADGIILASPVYTASISGQLKTLFDRMATCLHVMLLLNKPAVTLVTASSSYLKETSDYLSDMLQYFGAAVVCQVNKTTTSIDVPLEEAGRLLEEAIKSSEPLQLSSLTKIWLAKQTKRYKAMKFFSEILPDKFGEAKWWRELHPDL